MFPTPGGYAFTAGCMVCQTLFPQAAQIVIDHS
jgi:hypothetical protein